MENNNEETNDVSSAHKVKEYIIPACRSADTNTRTHPRMHNAARQTFTRQREEATRTDRQARPCRIYFYLRHRFYRNFSRPKGWNSGVKFSCDLLQLEN